MRRCKDRFAASLTAAMVLLATMGCTCAAAAMRPAPPAGPAAKMPCCIAHRPETSTPSVPGDKSPLNCPHCRQSLMLDRAAAPDFSLSFDGGVIFSLPPLLARIQIDSPAPAGGWGAESPLSIPPRLRLRLHCALVI